MQATLIVTEVERSSFNRILAAASYHLGQGNYVTKYPFLMVLDTATEEQVVSFLSRKALKEALVLECSKKC